MICPACSHKNSDSSQVCVECGASLTQQSVDVVLPTVSEDSISLSLLSDDSEDSEDNPAEVKVEPEILAEEIDDTSSEDASTDESSGNEEPEADVTEEQTSTTEDETFTADSLSTAEQADEQSVSEAEDSESNSEEQPILPNEVLEEENSSSTSENSDTEQDDPSPIIPPKPARAYQTPAPTGEALYKKGCLAAAYEDIMTSAHWLKTVVLLGLLGMVPILALVVNGYCMRWAKQLFAGKVEPMPTKIFQPRVFVDGWYAFVIVLVVMLVVGLVSSIVAFIPGLGSIAIIVLQVLALPVIALAYMRSAIANRLSAAFDIHQISEAFKKNVSAICCSTMVPYLVFGAVYSVILFALFLILLFPFMGIFVQIAEYGTASSEMIIQFLEAVTFAMPIFIVFWFVFSAAQAFVSILSLRATGHYLARYAQDWKSDLVVSED